MYNLTAQQHKDILDSLRSQAANQMSQYRQYDDHEQKYVLGYAKRKRRTGLGVVMEKGDLILVEPETTRREFVDMTGKQRCCIDVWSMRNQCQTAVDFIDVAYL